MRVNTRVEVDNINRILNRHGLGVRGRAQQYIDSEVLRQSAPYLPHQTGMLRDSGIHGTDIGSGEVIWNSPYAKFLYYGKVMIGMESHSPWAKSGEKKVKTNRNLAYHGAPKRGAFWFERMKADHMSDILRGLARLLGGRVR